MHGQTLWPTLFEWLDNNAFLFPMPPPCMFLSQVATLLQIKESQWTIITIHALTRILVPPFLPFAPNLSLIIDHSGYCKVMQQRLWTLWCWFLCVFPFVVKSFLIQVTLIELGSHKRSNSINYVFFMFVNYKLHRRKESSWSLGCVLDNHANLCILNTTLFYLVTICWGWKEGNWRNKSGYLTIHFVFLV